MRYSGVGGQAVMEGVMMRNGDEYAVAVRKPDKTIEVKKFEYKSAKKTKGLRNIPFIRGIFNFIDSLYLGMNTLMYSASFFEDEEEEQDLSKMTEEEKAIYEKKKAKEEKAWMGGTVVLSVVLALAIFFALPYFLSGLFHKVISSEILIALLEGVIRLVIFIGYIVIISRNEDIKRVFM